MTSAIVSVLVLALLVGVIVLLKWRLALAGLRRRDLAREGGMLRGRIRMNEVFASGINVFSPAGLSLFGGNPLGGGPVSPRVTKEQRAEAFLHRILALTGAKKVDGACPEGVEDQQRNPCASVSICGFFSLWSRILPQTRTVRAPERATSRRAAAGSVGEVSRSYRAPLCFPGRCGRGPSALHLLRAGHHADPPALLEHALLNSHWCYAE